MKRQAAVALALLLLIPLVLILGGFVSNLINPEWAAGHPNYPRNFQLLTAVKILSLLASAGLAAILWLLVCFLLIRSRQQSLPWLFLAALGPFGLAILAMLPDRAPAPTDRHALFVLGLRLPIRVAYEAGTFLALCLLAYQAMLVQRHLIILFQSLATSQSTAQIINIQNASSGMWAFGELLEVLFFLALFYLLRPLLFNLLSRLATLITSPKTQ